MATGPRGSSDPDGHSPERHGDIHHGHVESTRRREAPTTLPPVERRLPVHVPVSVEQYAPELTDRYGGSVEHWVRESISFHHRLLLRHIGRKTH